MRYFLILSTLFIISCTSNHNVRKKHTVPNDLRYYLHSEHNQIASFKSSCHNNLHKSNARSKLIKKKIVKR